jgi:uncharacterized protein
MTLSFLWRGPMRVASGGLILFVRGYQYLLRPLLPPTCRYQPGCSEYMIGAVRKYGPVVGAVKGSWRICRCNPFFPGGYDPP